MKNKIRFEALTQLTRLIHLTLLFLLFLFCSTIFLSMENNKAEDLAFCVVVDGSHQAYDITTSTTEGKHLFRSNCGSCHASDMASDLTGPALGDVTKRWSRNREGLVNWIRNSPKYLVENPEDKYTTSLAKKYAGTMTAFPDLRDEEIENILAYIEAVHNQ